MTAMRDVCALDDIPRDGKKAFKIEGKRILLMRKADEVFALENRCAHLNLPLSPGKFDGDFIVCPFHRARFCVRTGKLDRKAFLLGRLGKECVPTFPVSVTDGRVQVGLEPVSHPAQPETPQTDQPSA